MSAGAVIVAAGRGERFGVAGKVLAPVADRPMLAWSLDAFETADAIREIVIVAGAHIRASIVALVDGEGWSKITAIVDGGGERAESVRNGVAALPDDVEIAVIHDAARPLLTIGDIDGAIAAAVRCGAAIVATRVTDTLKHCADGVSVSRTIDRSTLWAAQTPQAFRRQALLDAFAGGAPEGFTDEAMLFESRGLPVEIVPGRRDNLKVTVPEDLPLVDFLMRRQLEEM